MASLIFISKIFLILSLSSYCLIAFALPHDLQLSKQERIARILAQKPLPTAALLAGAATAIPLPYPPSQSDGEQLEGTSTSILDLDAVSDGREDRGNEIEYAIQPWI